MANRTLKIYGQGYGTTPVSLEITLDGTTVFSGEIDTVDQPWQPTPQDLDSNTAPVIATISASALVPTEFAGTLPMTVTVSGGSAAYLGDIFSNYQTGNVDASPTAGTATDFGRCYFGTPTNSENTPDCRSSVEIDGVVQVPPLTHSKGTWWWMVSTGSTMTCDFNIAAGTVRP
jgi:hypothetical protein